MATNLGTHDEVGKLTALVQLQAALLVLLLNRTKALTSLSPDERHLFQEILESVRKQAAIGGESPIGQAANLMVKAVEDQLRG